MAGVSREGEGAGWVPLEGEMGLDRRGRPTDSPEAHGESWVWGAHRPTPVELMVTRRWVRRQQHLGQDRPHLEGQRGRTLGDFPCSGPDQI